MCDIYMLCKTGTVSLGVADRHFIFDHTCVCTLQTHMRRLLPTDLALTLNQLLIPCTIYFLPPLLGGGDT